MRAFALTFVAAVASVASVVAQQTYTVDRSGKGDFRSVQECFDALPSKPTEWRRVIIKEGDYRQKVTLDYYKDKVEIVGEGDVRIVWDDHTGRVEADGHVMTTYDSATMSICASDVSIEGITIANDAGRVGQAVAVETIGDRIEFHRCRMVGNQDTFFTKGEVSRVYVADCHIEGTTDYIFGPSIVLFDRCTLRSVQGSYITAASTTERNKYGYVFRDCRIEAADSNFSIILGRPWKQTARTVFMACCLPKQINPKGWYNWNAPIREKLSYYGEWRCKGEGADRSERVDWSHALTDEEAAEYTAAQIFAFKTGSEAFRNDWLPRFYDPKSDRVVVADSR